MKKVLFILFAFVATFLIVVSAFAVTKTKNTDSEQSSPITYRVYLNKDCDCYRVKFSNSSLKKVWVSYRYKGTFGEMTNGSVTVNGNSSKEGKAGSDKEIYDVYWEYVDE